MVAETQIKALPVSSLMLEDVAPHASASLAAASQQAPEQVLGKKRGKEASMMAEAELGSDDRKRLRRASKAANKAKRVRELDAAHGTQSQPGAAAGTGGTAQERKRQHEQESRALDNELRQDSRVVLTGANATASSATANKKAKAAATAGGAGKHADTTAYSKSSSFFSRLQQDTSDQIKKKSSGLGASKKGPAGAVTNPFAKSSTALKL